MATLKIQAPDGKTLKITVPEGTDPSEYDRIVDDVIGDYSGPKTGLDKAVGIAEGAQEAMTWPFKKAAEHIPGVAPALGAVGKGLEAIQKPFDVAGEKTAEFLASKGVPPAAAAGIGLPIQMAPEIALSAIGGRVAKTAATGAAKAAKRALPSEKVLSRGIAQAEAKAGIKQTAVNLKGVARDLNVPLEKNVLRGKSIVTKQIPQDEIRTAVINRVLEARRAGETLPPQVARDVVKLFDTELKKGKGFAGQIAAALGKAPTLEKGLLAQGKRYGQEIVSKAAPDREALAAALGRVKRTKKVAKVVGGGIGALALKKLLGSGGSSVVGPLLQ